MTQNSCKKPYKNIVLTGFMGAGKSTVGRKLATRLGYRFVDTDSLVEEAAGRPVKEIFSTDGEARFREMERAVIKKLADSSANGLVVSTGGGAVKDPANRADLKRIGMVVWLKVSLDEVFRRAFKNGRGDERPLIASGDKEAAGKLLQEREPFYAEADVIVDTSAMDVNSVVASIERHFIDARG